VGQDELDRHGRAVRATQGDSTAGGTTIERAVITDSLLRTSIRERSDAVREVMRQLQTQLPRPLERKGYSLEDRLPRKRKSLKYSVLNLHLSR